MFKRLFGKSSGTDSVSPEAAPPEYSISGGVATTSAGQETPEEIRAQRDELSTLMAGISDAILALDLEEQPLFYNSQFAVMVGPDRMKSGTKLIELIRDPDILTAYRYALVEGKNYNLKAIPHAQQDRKKYFSLSVSPLRRPDRTVYGAVGIFHDVTDLKMAEQLRTDFVANVSHELRTPLTAIKGYTDTIIEDVKNGLPAEKQFLDVIARNTDRLMLLIRDLLDLSTMDSGTDVIHKEKISTEEFTTRVISQMKRTLEAKNHTVEMHIHATFVHADLKRLEQVLVNLMDNASKYMPNGGAIQVSWESDTRGDTLLKVEDTGPGIPPEHHDRLFERFYRIDKGRSRDMGGTGLGLAIVKHIMQRHGGAVWVHSEPGQGAHFTCQFPG